MVKTPGEFLQLPHLHSSRIIHSESSPPAKLFTSIEKFDLAFIGTVTNYFATVSHLRAALAKIIFIRVFQDVENVIDAVIIMDDGDLW